MSHTSITLEQIINFLLEAPMFGDLDAAQLSQIVHIMQVQRLRDGQIVFKEGEPGDAWYVIFDGTLDVFKSEDFLPDQRIATLNARACFGEMAILDHSPRSASVVARGEATVFRFPRKEFEHLLHEDNLAAYKLIARTEGIFVEPACAAPLAGLIKCVQAGQIPEGSLITATMTGHGLKDPDTAISTAGFSPTVVPANKEAVMKVIGL